MNIFKIMPKATQISDLRITRGWTQEQLAQISGVDTRTIQRIEAGKSASLASLQALAAAFQSSVEELLDKSSDNSKEKNEPHINSGSNTQVKKEPKVYLLCRILTGMELMNVVGGVEMYHYDHDELTSASEAEAIAGFLQDVQDCGDIWGDLESGQRVKLTFECNNWIKEIETLGFAIFGIRRKLVWITGGDPKSRIPVEAGTIIIKRANDPRIVRTPDGSETLPSIFSNN